jgi:uncharacterized protein
MLIQREIQSHLVKLVSQYPVVAVMGPRQSGKTTLVRESFPHYSYVTLEDIDRRLEAKEDPRRFFASFSSGSGLILDEIQEAPELFSYMQGIVDQVKRPGQFVITGSQNFLLHEKISQTLAGRIALLTLLPLTVDELTRAQILPATLEELLLKGMYPRPYVNKLDPQLWFSNYSATYVERDVRQLINVTDILSFQRFLKLCAARVGNIINYADLARDCDISPHAAKKWLSVLEASYLIKLLYPYYKNFNKRVIKSPKLYFYDTGLVCSLLGIRSPDELFLHSMRGPIFESFIISEFFKYTYNQVRVPHFYFWRDIQGHEIDCLAEKSYDTLVPIEIKSGMTITSDFFKGLLAWQEVTKQAPLHSYVIYANITKHEYRHAQVIPWNEVKSVVAML